MNYNLNQSPNSMYRNYRMQFDMTYGTSKQPLSFKSWLEWAKSKGVLVGKFSADGDAAETQIQTIKNAVANAHVYILFGIAVGLGAAALRKSSASGYVGFAALGALLGLIVANMQPQGVSSTTTTNITKGNGGNVPLPSDMGNFAPSGYGGGGGGGGYSGILPGDYNYIPAYVAPIVVAPSIQPSATPAPASAPSIQPQRTSSSIPPRSVAPTLTPPPSLNPQPSTH